MSLKNLLGIEYPIFQGAMARIATAALAGPVSEAGGLGIIGSGGLTAAAVGFGTVVTVAAGFEIISQYIVYSGKSAHQLVDSDSIDVDHNWIIIRNIGYHRSCFCPELY